MAASLVKHTTRIPLRNLFSRLQLLCAQNVSTTKLCSKFSTEDNEIRGRNSTASTAEKKSATEDALNKFAKVVDKVNKARTEDSISTSDISENENSYDPNETFASMLRRSKFVSLGEHKGRLVQGEVIEVMEDDLYIDFGGKFHCVCPRPKRNGSRYQRGTKVTLSLECMEMSSAFLGSDIHVTLLEADATLLGLAANQKPTHQSQRNTSQKGVP